MRIENIKHFNYFLFLIETFTTQINYLDKKY